MPEWFLQWFPAGVAVTAAGTVLVALVKTWPAMKKVELEGEAALWAEIRLMRNEAKQAKIACDEQIARLEKSHDERIERLTARYEAALGKAEAETQIARHERTNMRGALNAFFVMIKRIDNPELASIAEAVEDMITRGDQAIAIEKSLLPELKAKDSL